MTALHCAAKAKRQNCAELLVERGATVDDEDNDGCTPLFYSVDSDNVATTRLLLMAGAYCDHRDRHGRRFDAQCMMTLSNDNNSRNNNNTINKRILHYIT